MVEIRDRPETRGGDGGGTSSAGDGDGGIIGGGGSEIAFRRGGRGVSISLGSSKSCGTNGKGTEPECGMSTGAKAPRGGIADASSPDEVPT